MFDELTYTPATEAAKKKKDSVFSKIRAWFSNAFTWIKNKIKEAAGKIKMLFEDLYKKVTTFFEEFKAAADERAAINAQKKAEKAVANTKAQYAKAKAAYNNAVGKMAASEDDVEDVEDIDIEVDPTDESCCESFNYDLTDAIEGMEYNIETKCTTAQEAQVLADNIENEIKKFNRDINTLKVAAESASYGKGSDHFKMVAAPAVESLRNSFSQVGIISASPSGIDEEACEKMSCFLTVAREKINDKLEELNGGYAGESFLSNLVG